MLQRPSARSSRTNPAATRKARPQRQRSAHARRVTPRKPKLGKTVGRTKRLKQRRR
jgi:hypothetical protein